MSNIKTPLRPEIWRKDLTESRAQTGIQQPREIQRNLTEQQVDILLKGTKSGRRRQAAITHGPIIDYEEEEDGDPDYEPDAEHFSETDETDEEQTYLEITSMLDSEPNLDSSGNFMQVCLAALQKFNNKHDWINVDSCELFDEYLSSAIKIRKLFNYEMDAICDVIFIFTGIQIFPKSCKKEHKVKQLCLNLGNNMEWITNSTLHEPTIEQSVSSLKLLRRETLLHSSYSKTFLRIAVANCQFERAVKKWEDNSTVPVKLSVPGLKKDHEIYCFPEFSARRLQVELRTLDFSHILTNIRTHLCKHGYDNVSTDAFLRVSEVNHDLLNRCLIEDILDKQKVAKAEKFFTEEVESVMIANGDTSAAKFIRMIRLWYEACDDRGLSFHTRLNNLQEAFDYIMEEFDALTFPPPTKSINQMPLTTYEAILQNISTRFLLYALRSQGYSQRAISTLDIESFFSDLTKLEFTGLGEPKAVDVPRLIKKAVFINDIKHDPNRGFELKTTSRSTYPYHLMQPSNQQITNTLQSKLFNVQDSKRMRRKRKQFDQIAKPKCVTRGGTTLRTKYYKYDESLLDMQKRAGIAVDIDISN